MFNKKNTAAPQIQNNIMTWKSLDTEVQQQEKLTLNDIMAIPTRMTPSTEGMEKKMEKLDIVKQKVDNVATRIESIKLEKVKRNQLEQYGRREMLEISGIPAAQDDNCIDIVYNLCHITSTDIKKSKIEVSHKTKNDDIIVEFKDRPSHDALLLSWKKKALKVLHLAMRTQYL